MLINYRLKIRSLQGYIGGDGGIRTLDRALQPYNGLANRRLQPLGHISAARRDSTPGICPTPAPIARPARSLQAAAPSGRTEFYAPLRPWRGRPFADRERRGRGPSRPTAAPAAYSAVAPSAGNPRCPDPRASSS